MFKRSERLAKTRDINRILKDSRRVTSTSFLIRLKLNKLNRVRVTVVVGTNYSKEATKRNRLKRQLREVLKASLKSRPRSQDIMVSVKPGAAKLTNRARLIEFKELLVKAGLN